MSIDGLLDINIPLTAVNDNGNNNTDDNVFIDALNPANIGTSNLIRSQSQQIDLHLQTPMHSQSNPHHNPHHQQQQQQNAGHLQNIQQQQQQQQSIQLPSILNNSDLGLTAQTATSTNLNTRVQYSQTNVVTTPSFVH